MEKHPICPLLLLLSLFFSFSCKTNLLVLEDMLPSAKHRDFDVTFSQTSLDDFSIGFILTYELFNPYKIDLPIPEHVMEILVNDDKIGKYDEHSTTIIPAKSSKLIHYELTINSDQLKNMMGKNNKISFNTSIEMDLTAFSKVLPNYQLSVSEDFDLETSELTPMINNLLQRKIGKFNFSYEHATQIKIPAPPAISKSTDPIEINLLGAGISAINPNAIKNALIPFGDLLVNGELDGLKDPFIDALVDLTVTIPDPTLLEWDRTRRIRMETYLLNLIKPFDSQIVTKWNGTKSLLYQSTSLPVADYFVDNFLNPHVDSQASVKWNQFQQAYNQLKTTVFPTEIPGPQTKGFEIAIPFIFHNKNEFPISIPIFSSSLTLSGDSPFAMYVKPKKMEEIVHGELPANHSEIPAKTKETLYVVFSFNMQAFNQGMYSLFMKNNFEPNLRGMMSYDFGYGPMYIDYDLEDMQLNYK
ncbi:hypothetical protein SAMN05192553_101540 [Cyclobacterium xiamenense]|uniref:Uncharacterized protein n=1 Tax=Cyclobacterium xiamenense TaxID=1297121 RepID=A0A1H6TYV8_9BACT|nr:hypothetical protein [Cyclobacterium xiamenense]SEI85219.1 hypothetical protein SAMN05192553_101540 [Cyclobacterium xiamenense]